MFAQDICQTSTQYSFQLHPQTCYSKRFRHSGPFSQTTVLESHLHSHVKESTILGVDTWTQYKDLFTYHSAYWSVFPGGELSEIENLLRLMSSKTIPAVYSLPYAYETVLWSVEKRWFWTSRLKTWSRNLEEYASNVALSPIGLYWMPARHDHAKWSLVEHCRKTSSPYRNRGCEPVG